MVVTRGWRKEGRGMGRCFGRKDIIATSKKYQMEFDLNSIFRNTY
jgi:hypothetical protein